MKANIFNRDFTHPEDGWYQIETPGEHPNKAGGVVQIIDAPAVQSIVNRFNQEAEDYTRKHGVKFPGMLIDHEHFKNDADKETRAYGWLMQMENRDGVPFGKIVWTTTGKQAVDGGEYRFFSSEYDPGDYVSLGGNKVRPVRLSGLSLTNQPNNKGGRPITNRGNPYPPGMKFEQALLNQQIPTPELETWFKAVGETVKVLSRASGHTLDFKQAWDLCKQQHPDLYAAAFGDDSKPDDSAGDINTATAGVTNLTNRIKVISGKDFSFAWNFVRENLPRIFNRQLTKRELLVNRTKDSLDDSIVQAKAAKLFGRLANAHQLSTKQLFSQSWQEIIRQEPVLHLLASGKCTPEQAFAQEPSLQNRLT